MASRRASAPRPTSTRLKITIYCWRIKQSRPVSSVLGEVGRLPRLIVKRAQLWGDFLLVRDGSLSGYTDPPGRYPPTLVSHCQLTIAEGRGRCRAKCHC